MLGVFYLGFVCWIPGKVIYQPPRAMWTAIARTYLQSSGRHSLKSSWSRNLSHRGGVQENFKEFLRYFKKGVKIRAFIKSRKLNY